MFSLERIKSELVVRMQTQQPSIGFDCPVNRRGEVSPSVLSNERE